MNFPWDKKADGLKKGADKFGTPVPEAKAANREIRARLNDGERVNAEGDHVAFYSESDDKTLTKCDGKTVPTKNPSHGKYTCGKCGAECNASRMKNDDGAGAAMSGGSGSAGAGGGVDSSATGYEKTQKTTTDDGKLREKENADFSLEEGAYRCRSTNYDPKAAEYQLKQQFPDASSSQIAAAVKKAYENAADRAVTQDDMNAAARGLNMLSMSVPDLRDLIPQHEGKDVFASKVVLAAAKQMLASKRRMGAAENAVNEGDFASKCAACNSLSDKPWSGKCGNCLANYDGHENGEPKKKDNDIPPPQGEPWDQQSYDIADKKKGQAGDAGERVNSDRNETIAAAEKHCANCEICNKAMKDRQPDSMCATGKKLLAACPHENADEGGLRKPIAEDAGKTGESIRANTLENAEDDYTEYKNYFIYLKPGADQFKVYTREGQPLSRGSFSSVSEAKRYIDGGKFVVENALQNSEPAAGEKRFVVETVGGRTGMRFDIFAKDEADMWRRFTERTGDPETKLRKEYRVARVENASFQNAGHLAAEPWAIASSEERMGWLLSAGQEPDSAVLPWVDLSMDAQKALQDVWDKPVSRNEPGADPERPDGRGQTVPVEERVNADPNHKCYGCHNPKVGDRVRDSSGQMGYGEIQEINGDQAEVRFGNRFGSTPMRLSELELVSGGERKNAKGDACPSCGSKETFEFEGAHGDNMSCSICDRTWDATRKNAADDTLWKCKKCGATFLTEATAEAHEKNKGVAHTWVKVERRENVSDLENGDRACRDCDATFKEAWAAEDHALKTKHRVEAAGLEPAMAGRGNAADTEEKLKKAGFAWTTSGSGDAYIIYRAGRDPQASMVADSKISLEDAAKKVLKNAISESQWEEMARAYEKIGGIDPTSPNGEKFLATIHSADDDTIRQLAAREIKFVSKIARNEMSRRGLKNSADDMKDFRGYLRQCTDSQVRGVYEKEKSAGRDEYAELAEAEAERRGISSRENAIRVPANHPVQPLKPGEEAEDKATCGTCHLSWDDAKITSMTPAPAGRCPFESYHKPMKGEKQNAITGDELMIRLKGRRNVGVRAGDARYGSRENARFSKCKKCGAWINLDFGADSPAEHSDAAGTKGDPRSPGDRDDICDVCDYGSRENTLSNAEPAKDKNGANGYIVYWEKTHKSYEVYADSAYGACKKLAEQQGSKKGTVGMDAMLAERGGQSVTHDPSELPGS